MFLTEPLVAVREIKRFDGIVVAMGRKVERVLNNASIDH
jgi:hypothetical protein